MFHLITFNIPLQAWLTEIHEYAQKDVVIMLLGNKVCNFGWEDKFVASCRHFLTFLTLNSLLVRNV